MITFQHNLASLNDILPEYRRVSGLTNEQVLVKQGSKLAYELSFRLLGLKPGKGAVRAQRLAAFKHGEGTKVRPSIIRAVMAKQRASVSLADRERYKSGKGVAGVQFNSGGRLSRGKLVTKKGKTRNKDGLNLWNLIVKRELNARESGAGYMSWAAKMRVKNVAGSKLVKHFGRVQQELGQVGLIATPSASSLQFTFGGKEYGGAPIQVGEALQKPAGQAAIASAMDAVRKDIGVYLARKHSEALQGAVDKATAAARRIR